MAHSNTQFDEAQIVDMAKRHTDLAQDVTRQLAVLHGQISQTAAGASSDMTIALEMVYSNWERDVNKDVMDNLGLMAQSMTQEARNQEMADTDNTRQINNTISPLGSYLGG